MTRKGEDPPAAGVDGDGVPGGVWYAHSPRSAAPGSSVLIADEYHRRSGLDRDPATSSPDVRS